MSRILGIDYGEKRVGVAVSDELHLFARPLKTLEVKDIPSLIEEVRSLVKEHEVIEIVIGLPKNMDGTLGFSAERVQQFVQLLGRALAIPIRMCDERLTSIQAQKILLPLSRKQRRERIDTTAAQLILQNYLDSLRK